MKKIFSMALMLLGGIAVLTSCDEDRDSNPTVQKPTGFVLNTPAMADQYVELSADNSVNLTWSQPDYGYNAYATYQIQVGLIQRAAPTFGDGGENIVWNEKDGEPKYLDTPYFKCNANINAEEIAMAINEIDGVTSEDDYVDLGYRQIAMRIRSTIQTSVGDVVPGTEIISNTIVFNNMKAYCAVKSPAPLWIIGNCSGWNEPSEGNAAKLADWRIFETEIGSNVFVGIKEIPEGTLQFRFYSALTGWDGGASIGATLDAADDDQDVDCVFTDGVYSGTCDVPSKDKWKFDFPGGNLKFTVDLNQKIVKFEIVE